MQLQVTGVLDTIYLLHLLHSLHSLHPSHSPVTAVVPVTRAALQVAGVLDMIQTVYKYFGMNFALKLSTRPESALGDIEVRGPHLLRRASYCGVPATAACHLLRRASCDVPPLLAVAGTRHSLPLLRTPDIRTPLPLGPSPRQVWDRAEAFMTEALLTVTCRYFPARSGTRRRLL